MRRRQLGALTGVRFFAATHVVVYHYGRGLARLPGAGTRILDQGFAGVTLFFVLSGFILAYNHAGDGPRQSAREFWAGRFARIYPVYALGLVLALPALLAPLAGAVTHGRELALALGTTPLLLQSWVPSIAGRWNGPAWSLSAEALFYLAFPALALLAVRLRRRGALLLALGAWATSIAVVAVYLRLRPDGQVYPGIPTALAPWLSYVRYHPLARLPEFVLGVATGRLFLLREATTLPAHRRRAEAVAVLAVAATLAVAASPVTPPFPSVHGGLLAPLFAVALYALAAADGHGPLSRLLASAPAVRLGEASYALYILHVPLHDLLSRAVMATPWRPPAVFFFDGYLAFTIVASLCVYALFEVPARRIVRGWLAGRGEREVTGMEATAARAA